MDYAWYVDDLSQVMGEGLSQYGRNHLGLQFGRAGITNAESYAATTVKGEFDKFAFTKISPTEKLTAFGSMLFRDVSHFNSYTGNHDGVESLKLLNRDDAPWLEADHPQLYNEITKFINRDRK